MIDFKDSLQVVIFSLVVSFLFFIIILHFIRPSWVITINDLSLPVVSPKLVIYFSSIFSLVVTIMVLLLVFNKGGVRYSLSSGFNPTICQFCD